ncbi:MAG: hypothetical protein OJJ21_14175 [Ferrovibrio sp.]|uniref:hypothetical protein n=1 Tax=Ferrovibrio sp. TaxID=1917215 RepID=UPI00262F4A09|nr:hypothetical protein [Ferrovibrio sp.]MCW0234742.1 hypothetical protein [Ferrovibrio sp.]
MSVNEEAWPVAKPRTAGAAGGGGDDMDPPSYPDALFWDVKAEVVELDDYRPGASAKRRARQSKEGFRMVLMSGARTRGLRSRHLARRDLRAMDLSQDPFARRRRKPSNDN